MFGDLMETFGDSLPMESVRNPGVSGSAIESTALTGAERMRWIIEIAPHTRPPNLRVQHSFEGCLHRKRGAGSLAVRNRVNFFCPIVRPSRATWQEQCHNNESCRFHSEAFDSYDEDSAWIIDRLVERVGRHFGVIMRYLAPEKEGSIIGRGMPRALYRFA
jgi:hypothetical protein